MKIVSPCILEHGWNVWKKINQIFVNVSIIVSENDLQALYVLQTHEESASELLASLGPLSYKNFPIRLYQTTSKYRDEMKPRFGLMRSRQFIMKDLYTFDVDMDSARRSYDLVCTAYDHILKRIGLDFVRGEWLCFRFIFRYKTKTFGEICTNLY